MAALFAAEPQTSILDGWKNASPKHDIRYRIPIINCYYYKIVRENVLKEYAHYNDYKKVHTEQDAVGDGRLRPRCRQPVNWTKQMCCL